MPASPAGDPILKRFRAALDTLYGDRIERLVAFGSRARGDAQEDSDYDVAVFLKSLADCWPEVDRIVPLVTDILYEGVPLSTPCPTGRAPMKMAPR
jgi:uncharacterized protein